MQLKIKNPKNLGHLRNRPAKQPEPDLTEPDRDRTQPDPTRTQPNCTTTTGRVL
jgi:hypothetical protein